MLQIRENTELEEERKNDYTIEKQDNTERMTQMIYCLEDERNIRELIVYTLQTTGFDAIGFSNADDFMAAVDREKPELVLLDIMLPKENGFSILKRLKANVVTQDIPVIMVSAKGSEFDKVTGLNLGADDYISKPFGMMEFVARVRAVLRRGGLKEKSRDLGYKNLIIKTEKHQVLVENQNIDLTLKEYELLKYLVENQGIVLTRNQILEHIWGYDFDGETRTVDVHIRTMRQKLGEYGNYVETVRGVGYRIGG